MAGKPASTARIASNRPDEMSQGGLKDDINATITKVRYAPWDYNGNLDHFIFAVAVTMDIEGEDEPFTQYYSAGDLTEWIPSNDGEGSVDLDSEDPEEREGIYALAVGDKERLSNSSNWAHFVAAAIKAGFPVDLITPDVTFLEGTTGHLAQVPQKKRSGIVVAEGEEKKERTILVLTEITSGGKQEPAKTAQGKAGAGKATATATKPAAGAKKGGEPSLEDRLVDMVVQALAGSDDGTVAKKSLAALAMKTFAGAEKAKAVNQVGKPDFLAGHEDSWLYDAEGAVLIKVE